MRVLAAMSGGVDSAVAAARAVDAGHDVTGVHLALSRHPQSFRSGARGCCTLEDSRDARRAADVLGIPFYVWDLSERFAADVVDDFVAEYAAGRTPNPCLRCNERIKFAAVLDRALALGFDAVCTGHYARLVDGPTGRELHRAADPAKDQSYVLGVLTAEQLAGSMFPLGDVAEDRGPRRGRPPRVGGRAQAGQPRHLLRSQRGHGRLAQRPGRYRARCDRRPGRCRARPARRHARLHGRPAARPALERPAADGRPRYVLSISPVDRTVTVGPHEALVVRSVEGIHVRWCGRSPAGVVSVTAQLRAHGDPVPARAASDGERLLVDLDEPVHGIAPGQAVVLYDGTRVVGSATIDRTSSVSAFVR